MVSRLRCVLAFIRHYYWEYLGIKFVAPDVDQISWLSFGRLRPVHTNTVFWGWASLAM
jgi:cytochrome c oxidase cbb3-type subunit 1